MENPIKVDDLGVPLFLETPACRFYKDFIQLYLHWELSSSHHELMIGQGAEASINFRFIAIDVDNPRRVEEAGIWWKQTQG